MDKTKAANQAALAGLAGALMLMGGGLPGLGPLSAPRYILDPPKPQCNRDKRKRHQREHQGRRR